MTIVHPLATLIRRYAYAYTASHDFSVLPSLMVERYLLRMGPHVVGGRDSDYQAATERQFQQFPGLGFTVHQIIVNGARLAMHFTEHGASVRHDGRSAAWSGVSLYQWDGRRLTECRVEQDYWSRRRQLADGAVNPIQPPGVDPWTGPARAPNLRAEAAVRDWLLSGALDSVPIGSLNDEAVGAEVMRTVIDVEAWQVDDLFSAGRDVAFHVSFSGQYVSGLQGTRSGVQVTSYATGIATVSEEGSVGQVRAVTDRLGVMRAAAQVQPS